MTTEMQMTFGENVGMPPLVLTANLPTDLVECVDTGELVARSEVTFHKNGDAYEYGDDLGECPNCFENVECDELDDNGGWCEECDSDERVVCVDCDAHVLTDDSYTNSGGDAICEECRDNYYSYCEDCEDLFSSDDASVIGECYVVCARCLRNNYTRCDDCGEYDSDDNIRRCENGDDICDSCYDASYSHCEECNEIFHYEHLDSNGCCEGCAEEDDYVAPPRRTYHAESTAPVVCADYSLGSDLDSDRTYGLEWELSSVRDLYGCDRKMRDAGWRAGRDGSVNGDDREYASPVLKGNDGLRKIRDAAGILKGSSADRSAGFHLHLGMADLNDDERRSVALAYHYTCDVWHAFVKPARDNYNYSRRHTRYYNRRDIINASDVRYLSTERYVWVNWKALSSHTTVEIRLHHGTCDGYEAQSWVKAHVRFIDAVSKLSVAQVTRVFGGKDRFALFAELSRIWDEAELTDYYARKAAASDRPVRKIDAA